MKKVMVHKFRMGDVEDPEIYAGSGLYEFTQSEKGQWVMEHAHDKPYYVIRPDLDNYGYLVQVIAELPEQATMFFALKW